MAQRFKEIAAFMLPFYVLMCFATVYILAHYAIDAIAGLITGVAFYFLFLWLSKDMIIGKSTR